MILKALTRFLFAAVSIVALHSCERQSIPQVRASSGLFANRVYSCDSITHNPGLRLFTNAGEVYDAAVIEGYVSRHAVFSGLPSYLRLIAPGYLYTTFSDTVFDAEHARYAVKTESGLVMQQLDTVFMPSVLAGDSIYEKEQWFLSMSRLLLERNGSYTDFERVNSDTYHCRELSRITGTYVNGNVRYDAVILPYSFLASGDYFRAYPFAMKADLPGLPSANDTVLVREGKMVFRVR